MGIKDLISKVFPDDMKIESSFEVLKNKTMGVDVSNYMFKLVTMRDNLVRDFHCEPRLDISAHIYKFWDLFKKTCDNYSILIVLVLDGMRNPAKKDTNVLRDTMRQRNLQKLEELLSNGDNDDGDEVLKLQKSTRYITEDMLLAVKIWAIRNGVRCVQSLYEADAGLQHLEDMGLTDGTFSEDGDFFALGSKLWATKVSTCRGTFLIVFVSGRLYQTE
jgi:5'-3' exonuclease